MAATTFLDQPGVWAAGCEESASRDIELSELLPPSPPPEPSEDYVGDDGGPIRSSTEPEIVATGSETVPPTPAADLAGEGCPPANDVGDDHCVRRLAHQLAGQLITFRGCCADCHQTADVQHDKELREHISIAAYLEHAAPLCPQILGSPSITSAKDNQAGKISPTARRQIYCGLESSDVPLHICVSQDEQVTERAGTWFDVDSVTGFPSSLSVAKQGIRWFPTQMSVSDLQPDLHLSPRKVQYFDAGGNRREVCRPVHQIPHYTFGRLRDKDFRLWMDCVLLPIIYEHYSSSFVQHYPSSYDHSRHNATARGVETHAQRAHPIAREQQSMYYLPPETLEAVWTSILDKVQDPGFQHFRGLIILFQAKSWKVLTKDPTWNRMVERFQTYWVNAVDEIYVTDNSYFGIGKETCPQQASQVAPSVVELTEDAHPLLPVNTPAETLLYR